MEIQNIVWAIIAGNIVVTRHAEQERLEDELSFDEIYLSVVRGEIIEEYPLDSPYPSCLIYGDTFRGDPVHSVWAYNESNGAAVLVTVYRPDPERWVNYRYRRREGEP